MANLYAVICLQVAMSVSKMPSPRSAPRTRVLTLAKTQSLVRTRDVAALGIHTGALTRLARTGELEKVGPGRYRLAAKRQISEHHDLVLATSAIPGSVVCLGRAVHRIEGQAVNVYNVARTVADCFRFRNTIGLDVALEALTEAWRSRRLNLDELHRIAKRLRVHRVMQPYLETVVL